MWETISSAPYYMPLEQQVLPAYWTLWEIKPVTVHRQGLVCLLSWKQPPTPTGRHGLPCPHSLIIFFLRFYVFIFRERERERERQKHQCVVASHAPPTGDLAHNPGMCPDWESNQQPFGSQAIAQFPGVVRHTSQGLHSLIRCHGIRRGQLLSKPLDYLRSNLSSTE